MDAFESQSIYDNHSGSANYTAPVVLVVVVDVMVVGEVVVVESIDCGNPVCWEIIAIVMEWHSVMVSDSIDIDCHCSSKY